MKKINLILAITFLFHSCGGFKEAGKVLRNEKVKTTDTLSKGNSSIEKSILNEIKK